MTDTLASTGLDVSGLDWEAFCAARFPHGRRHDFEAIVAYGAYRRPRSVDERSPDGVARIEAGRKGVAGSTALQSWEDEGGTAR